MSTVEPPQPKQHPWSRKPGEPEGAYLFFKLWLTTSFVAESAATSVVAGKAPKRSLPRAAERAGVSVTTFRQYAAKWNWDDRARAYDSHLLQRHLDGELETLDEAKRRNAAVLDKALSLVELTIDRMHVVMVDEKTKTREALQIAKVDLPKLLDRVLHHRALLVGAPTANEAVSVAFGDDWDLSGLTDEDLATFVRLRAKVKRRG